MGILAKENLAEHSQTAKVQKLMDEAGCIRSTKCLGNSIEAADKIVKDDADSVQAIQTQFILAKLAYDKQDYAAAEKALKKVENSKVEDAGLVQIVKIRLADAQLAQKKYDEAIKTLSTVTDPAFKANCRRALVISMLQKRYRIRAKKPIKVHGISWLNVNKSVKFYKLNSKVLAF